VLQKVVDQVRLTVDVHNVASRQSPAPSSLHLTVNLDFAALDQQLRLPARFGNATELQELM
jgi:hypothetical protein